MSPERLRQQVSRPDLWDLETVRRAATALYARTEDAHRTWAHGDEDAHEAAADILNRAYWAEVDDPEPARFTLEGD